MQKLGNAAKYCLVLYAICMLALFADGSTPNIEMNLLSDDNNTTINAHFTDSDGDLSSATMYVADSDTHDVLWAERWIIEGGEANLSFVWKRQMWRVTNGVHFAEPVLAVNTIGMPPGEAPYLFLSAPCLLRLVPEAQEVTVLAYFGQDGEFHSLTDLSGTSYYKSMELLRAVSPETPYGRYAMNNITPIVGLTSIRFFHLNIDKGLIAYPPLLLSRSPIQHYTLRLDGIRVASGSKIYVIDAEDQRGNRARKFQNITVN